MDIHALEKLAAPVDEWEVRTPHGSSISVRRHGNPDGPAMVLSHGNGFSIQAYLPFWFHFLERFDLFVFDIRNHGRNPVSDREIHHVPQFVEDAECVVRSIDGRVGNGKPRIGVFHSLSALVALHHATRGGEFSALVLFDPPVCPPGGLPEDMEGLGARLREHVLRRQRTFESPAEFASLLGRSPFFGLVEPDVLELLARTTLRRSADSPRFELCCPREYEAQILEYLFLWSMTVELDSIACPVKAIGADPTFPYSFMPSMDLSDLVQVNYDFLPETSHLLQLEKPEMCAALTIEFLAGLGLV